MIDPVATDPKASLIRDLASITATDPSDWRLVFKARYGLKLIYDALKAIRGDGCVATQAYTCLTAVAPILTAGLEPRYLDISRDTLAIDPAALKALDARPLAVVDQHTMGLIDNAASRSLADAAHERGAIVVEDGAHAVGRMARDDAGNPLADVCVYSFGIEKILPDSRFGGAVWINPSADEKLRAELAQSFEALPPIGPALEKACKAYRNQTRLLARMPSGLAKSTNARWIAKGKREPAVADAERDGYLPHKAMTASPWIAAEADRDLVNLGENFIRREETVAAYNEAFRNANDLFVPATALESDQPLLRYPVFARSRAIAETMIAKVNALGYYCVAWYRPLLFPGANMTAYHIPEASALPTSHALSEGAVSLPADIGAKNAREVADVCLAIAKEA